MQVAVLPWRHDVKIMGTANSLHARTFQRNMASTIKGLVF